MNQSPKKFDHTKYQKVWNSKTGEYQTKIKGNQHIQKNVALNTQTSQPQKILSGQNTQPKKNTIWYQENGYKYQFNKGKNDFEWINNQLGSKPQGNKTVGTVPWYKQNGYQYQWNSEKRVSEWVKIKKQVKSPSKQFIETTIQQQGKKTERKNNQLQSKAEEAKKNEVFQQLILKKQKNKPQKPSNQDAYEKDKQKKNHLSSSSDNKETKQGQTQIQKQKVYSSRIQGQKTYNPFSENMNDHSNLVNFTSPANGQNITSVQAIGKIHGSTFPMQICQHIPDNSPENSEQEKKIKEQIKPDRLEYQMNHLNLQKDKNNQLQNRKKNYDPPDQSIKVVLLNDLQQTKQKESILSESLDKQDDIQKQNQGKVQNEQKNIQGQNNEKNIFTNPQVPKYFDMNKKLSLSDSKTKENFKSQKNPHQSVILQSSVAADQDPRTRSNLKDSPMKNQMLNQRQNYDEMNEISQQESFYDFKHIPEKLLNSKSSQQKSRINELNKQIQFLKSQNANLKNKSLVVPEIESNLQLLKQNQIYRSANSILKEQKKVRQQRLQRLELQLQQTLKSKAQLQFQLQKIKSAKNEQQTERPQKIGQCQGSASCLQIKSQLKQHIDNRTKIQNQISQYIIQIQTLKTENNKKETELYKKIYSLQAISQKTSLKIKELQSTNSDFLIQQGKREQKIKTFLFELQQCKNQKITLESKLEYMKLIQGQKAQILIQNQKLQNIIADLRRNIAQVEIQKIKSQEGYKSQLVFKDYQVQELYGLLQKEQLEKKEQKQTMQQSIKDLNIKITQSGNRIKQLQLEVSNLIAQNKAINQVQNVHIANIAKQQQTIKDFFDSLNQTTQLQIKMAENVKSIQSQKEQLQIKMAENIKKIQQQKEKQMKQIEQKYIETIKQLHKKFEEEIIKKNKNQQKILKMLESQSKSREQISKVLAQVEKANKQTQTKLIYDKQMLIKANRALEDKLNKTIAQKMKQKWNVQDLQSQIKKNEMKYQGIAQIYKKDMQTLQQELKKFKNYVSSIKKTLNNLFQTMKSCYPQNQNFKKLDGQEKILLKLVQFFVRIIQKVHQDNKYFLQSIITLQSLGNKALQSFNQAQKKDKNQKNKGLQKQQLQIKSQNCKNIWGIMKKLMSQGILAINSKDLTIKMLSQQKIDLNVIIDEQLKEIKILKDNSETQTTLLNQTNMEALKQKMKLDRQIKDYIQTIEKMNRVLNLSEQNMKKIQKELTQKNQRIDILSKKVTSLQGQVNQLKDKTEKLQARIKVLLGQKTILQRQIKSLQGKISDLNDILAETKENLKNQRQKNKQLENKNNELKIQNVAKTSELEIKSKQMENLSTQKISLQQQIVQQRSKIQILRGQRQKLQKESKELAQSNELQRLHNNKKEQQIKQLNHKCEKLDQNIKIIGATVQKKLQSEKSLTTFEKTLSFIQSFQVRMPSVLIVSNILLGYNKQREWLTNQIQRSQGKRRILKSSLLFHSQLSQNAKLGKSLPKADAQFSIIVLFKSKTNVVFGSFSKGMDQQTILFGLKENNKNVVYANNKKELRIPGIKFQNSMFLIYGATEMKLKTNNLEQVIISTPCGSKYFSNIDWLQLTGSNDSTVKIKEIEVHKIQFE